MKVCLVLLVVLSLCGLLKADFATSDRKWSTPTEELQRLRDGLILARKRTADNAEKKEKEVSQGNKLARILDGLDKEERADDVSAPVGENKKEADALDEIEQLAIDRLKKAEKIGDAAKDASHDDGVRVGEDDKVLTADDDDVESDVHDHGFDDFDEGDAYDDIFYSVAGLKDEIKHLCGIDLEEIFAKFNPSTLADTNGSMKKLQDATNELTKKLKSTKDFAESLEQFVKSDSYSDTKVAEFVNKTFESMDETLDPLIEKLFCAEASLIVNRLRKSLFGGTGFANGFLCNRFFVEMLKYGSNATKVLNAAASDDSFLKNYTLYLAEDITCYEREMEVFSSLIPTTEFSGISSLQVAAFTESFLIDYGVTLLYHRILLNLAGEILTEISCAHDDDDSNDVREEEDLGEEADSLTSQLQKLLKKLNDVSAKKKALEDSMASGKAIATGLSLDKTSIKRSYYREREERP